MVDLHRGREVESVLDEDEAEEATPMGSEAILPWPHGRVVQLLVCASQHIYCTAEVRKLLQE